MQFNSLEFPVYFLVVYGTYLLLRKSFKAQNTLLLAASYYFYGYWDWRFCSLLAISTIVDFHIGKRLGVEEDEKKRKRLVTASIVTNLSILGFFKYFNFFVENFSAALTSIGLPANDLTLKVILPVGISFYTFQTLSYTIDIYRRQMKPTKSMLDFALFVAFYPQLVAGPIERARNLLPQMSSRRTISARQIDAGLFLLVWGYFKKVVISDNLVLVTNQIFHTTGYAGFDGLDVVLGIISFTVQIYCDFSGYSDISRGLAKLMGFEFQINFRLPFFAASPSDLWNRWHISLSSWLRDYLYIPLGGNRGSKFATNRNLMITMLLGGFWHGANWPYILWGGYQGAILVVHRLLTGGPKRANDSPEGWGAWGRIALMLPFTMIGFLIVRADSMPQFWHLFTHIGWSTSSQTAGFAQTVIFFTVPLMIVQFAQHLSGNLMIIMKLPLWQRALVYGFFVIAIFIFGVRDPLEFFYFQF